MQRQSDVHRYDWMIADSSYSVRRQNTDFRRWWKILTHRAHFKTRVPCTASPHNYLLAMKYGNQGDKVEAFAKYSNRWINMWIHLICYLGTSVRHVWLKSPQTKNSQLTVYCDDNSPRRCIQSIHQRISNIFRNLQSPPRWPHTVLSLTVINQCQIFGSGRIAACYVNIKLTHFSVAIHVRSVSFWGLKHLGKTERVFAHWLSQDTIWVSSQVSHTNIII